MPQKRRLGVLLSTPPSHPHTDTVVRLCEQALASEVDVYLYLIDEGVRHARDTRIDRLAASGAKLYLCAYGCQQHGVSTDGLPSSLTLCGLVVLSNLVNACDRFVAFN